MAEVNTAAIWVKVANSPVAERKMRAAAEDRAKVVFDDAVLGLQSEFEESKVTQEIDGGVSSANISETLRGGEGPENLYSFIGFNNVESGLPTDPIRKRLDPTNTDGPKITYKGKTGPNTTNFRFSVRGPNLSAIYSETPIPWAKGMSWAQKIEGIIPGFAQFLPKYMKERNSRSGGGIQVPVVLRPASYSPPEEGYIQTMVENFLSRIKQYGKFNQGGWRKRF